MFPDTQTCTMTISALFPSQRFLLMILCCPLVFLLFVGLLQAYHSHLGRLLTHKTATSFPILGSILYHKGPLCEPVDKPACPSNPHPRHHHACKGWGRAQQKENWLQRTWKSIYLLIFGSMESEPLEHWSLKCILFWKNRQVYVQIEKWLDMW